MSWSDKSPAARAERLEKTDKPKAQKLSRKKLSAEPMAQLLGVSWPTLRKWTRDIPGFEASKAFSGGERGMAYQFWPVGTVNFLIKHFRREAQKRSAATKKVREVIGTDVLGEEDNGMSLDDMQKAIRVRAAMIDQQVREGRLMDAGVVCDAATAEKFENAVESIMVKIQSAGAKCLDELRGSSHA